MAPRIPTSRQALPSAGGYTLQIYQLFVRLLRDKPDTIILEGNDDIEEVTVNLKTALQLKSGSSKPLTDSSPDVWKTLYNWFLIEKSKEGNERVRYALLTTQPQPSENSKSMVSVVFGGSSSLKKYDSLLSAGEKLLKKRKARLEQQLPSQDEHATKEVGFYDVVAEMVRAENRPTMIGLLEEVCIQYSVETSMEEILAAVRRELMVEPGVDVAPLVKDWVHDIDSALLNYIYRRQKKLPVAESVSIRFQDRLETIARSRHRMEHQYYESIEGVRPQHFIELQQLREVEDNVRTDELYIEKLRTLGLRASEDPFMKARGQFYAHLAEMSRLRINGFIESNEAPNLPSDDSIYYRDIYERWLNVCDECLNLHQTEIWKGKVFFDTRKSVQEVRKIGPMSIGYSYFNEGAMHVLADRQRGRSLEIFWVPPAQSIYESEG